MSLGPAVKQEVNSFSFQIAEILDFSIVILQKKTWKKLWEQNATHKKKIKKKKQKNLF